MRDKAGIFLWRETVSGWLVSISKNLAPFKIDFILLILTVILANFRYGNAAIMKPSDTIYIFQPFYIFYNDFFYHGELTRWLPYGSYGIPAAYRQFYYLSPLSYFTGILGWIFRVENVMGLFKASLFLEQLAMVWGAYKLCGELFKKRVTVFFVCFGLVATTFWFLNPLWNFRIYYLMPLMLYFLILFFRHRRGHWLWLAAAVFWLSMTGNVTYFSVVQGIVLLSFFLCFAVPDKFYLPWIFERSRKNILAFLLAAVAAVTIAYFAWHMMDYIKGLQYGRAEDSLQVSMQDFLTLGVGVHWGKFIELLTGGIHNVSTLYLGLLPLVFILYGLGTNRSRAFAAVWIAIVFLVALSVGDKTPVARLMYFLFPPMRWFRYLGQLGGLIRFFLLIAAGFGLDRFLEAPGRGEAGRKKRVLFFGCSAGFLVLIYFLEGLGAEKSLSGIAWPGFYPLVLTLAVVSLAVLNLLAAGPARVLGLVCLIFFSADMTAYQHATFKTAQSAWRVMPREVGRVHPYFFQNERQLPFKIKNDAGTSRIRSVREFMKLEEFFPFNNEQYTFMQFDTCFGECANDLQMRNVYEALVETSSFQLLHTFVNGRLREDHRLTHTPSWQSIFACGEKKLRLYPGASLVEDKRLARLMSDREIDLGRTLVLRSESPAPSPQPLPPPLPAVPLGNIHVRSFTFNRLVLDVDVFLKDPAWLYYSDAWHPGWRAYLDGRRTEIAQAFGAFKAVEVGPGMHEVRFEYFDGLRSAAGSAIAVMGVLFGAVMVLAVIAECFNRAREQSAA